MDEAIVIAGNWPSLGIKTGLYVAPLLNVGSEMEKEASGKSD